MVGFKLTQSQATFDKLVLNALAQEVDKYFRTSIKQVLDPVREAVRSALRSSDTIRVLEEENSEGLLVFLADKM